LRHIVDPPFRKRIALDELAYFQPPVRLAAPTSAFKWETIAEKLPTPFQESVPVDLTATG
jgi:hypothetical protein